MCCRPAAILKPVRCVVPMCAVLLCTGRRGRYRGVVGNRQSGQGLPAQAVQNMNIMFGLDEQAGLDVVPLLP